MFFLTKRLLLPILVSSALSVHASDIWNAPAFSADPEALRHAAAAIKSEKDADGTILLSERRFVFDASGKKVEVRHTIFRVETEEGVTSWARTEGQWDPWYQAKPQIKARVLTADGAVHLLDPKTLNDVPVHEDSSDMYSGQRALGGPLPAIAPGAIVEEEVITRETAPFFAGGIAENVVVAWSAPVHETRIVLVHPESLPLKYALNLLPKAVVSKSSVDGIETITVEQGPMEAYTEQIQYAPPEVLFPQIQFATGSSWQQVASEYAHAVQEKLRLADVGPVLAKLNLNGNVNEGTVRKIVAVLHKNVRYTGIEFGESGLIPQFPAETLKRKYGDCKDKATLLVAMLGAAGIPARLALLSTGPGQDVNQDLPGMGVFDHAIVYIPPSNAVPELWIDATAQYSRVGYLPEMDYGRWALIVDDKTTTLKKIPELTAEQNVHVETREFLLSEYGPATIKEVTEKIGPGEAGYRGYYANDSKEVRENAEEYVKNMYLADSLKSLQKSDPSDLEKPFALTIVAEGRRGITDLKAAVAAIRTESLFNHLPAYFYTEEQPNKGNSEEPPSTPRTVDWQIPPFITEWRYKFIAPAGFKLRALPANKDERMATARFIQKYQSDDAGNVEAVLRFESGKSRLTVEEAKALRDAVVKASKAEPVLISFDQVGYGLLAEGKVKEALASLQKLSSQHPKEALHQIRMARVLLDAGLGERARAIAKEATLLEPNSALAFSTLGWVLQHDLIGRRFKKGFDYEGAVAAYQKAKKLDPKDKDLRTDLAILLEYDSSGVRYSNKARLQAAIAEYEELKKQDEGYSRSLDDNVLFDLWYSGDFKKLREVLATLSSSDLRKSLLVAAVDATEGREAALKTSLEITSEPEMRSQALVSAAYHLLRIRKYGDAADLMAEASGKTAQRITALAGVLRKTKLRDQLKIDDSDPTSAIQKVFVLLFSGNADKERIAELISRDIMKHSDLADAASVSEFNSVRFALRSQAESSGLPFEVLADVVVSSGHYSKEGDDNSGYKITMEFPGSTPGEAFVVREDGKYKLVDIAPSSYRVPEFLGWEVLVRLEKNDLAGARRWLDWAREAIHLDQGDDPLSGQPFPHFWTKGAEGDAAAIRTAALILLPPKNLIGDNFSELVHARDTAKSDADRTKLSLVLAYACAGQQRWAELLPIAEELMKAAPDSLTAFRFAASAYQGLKKTDDWEKLLAFRLQKHPDDPGYLRAQATFFEYRGEAVAARGAIKKLIDRAKATENDLNEYAWDALMLPDPIGQETIDAAQRANELTKNANFGILHTLACLYAEEGKTVQARELLFKAMDAADIEEPNSEVWFGLGKIAEQYGETEAARSMYSRMEKPKIEFPTSSYSMGQQRLAAMQKSSAAAAKNGGQ